VGVAEFLRGVHKIAHHGKVCTNFDGRKAHTNAHHYAPLCLLHTSTASSPGFSLGAPRSSVASGAGLEPGVPRGRALAQDLRNGHLGWSCPRLMCTSSEACQISKVIAYAAAHRLLCGAKVTCTARPVMRCCPLRGSRCVTPLGIKAFTFIPGTPCGTTTVPGKTPRPAPAGTGVVASAC